MIDMALIEANDDIKWAMYLSDAKRCIRELSVFIHANVNRPGDLDK